MPDPLPPRSFQAPGKRLRRPADARIGCREQAVDRIRRSIPSVSVRRSLWDVLRPVERARNPRFSGGEAAEE